MNALSPQFSDGRLFLVRDGNLLAQSFDPSTGNTRGELVPVVSGVEYYFPRGIANFSIVDSGVLIYRESSVPLSRIAWLDRMGAMIETVGEPVHSPLLRLSANGEVAASVRTDDPGRNSDVWIVDLARKTSVRSTFIATDDEFRVALSRDGRRLAYSVLGETRIKPATAPVGRGTAEVRFPGTLWDWSTDGRYITLQTQIADTMNDVSWVALRWRSRSAPGSGKGTRPGPGGKRRRA